MKTTTGNVLTMSSALRINNNDFGVMKKKSKDYYTLIKSAKAQFPNNSKHLKQVFNLTDDQVKKGFALPHTVGTQLFFEIEVNSDYSPRFQRIILKFSFCKSEPETSHLFFQCVHSQAFWKTFESFYYFLSKDFVHLSLQEVLIGIIIFECPLLNYLLLTAKVYTVLTKYETEEYMSIKNGTAEKFNRKWALKSGFVF